MLARDPEPVTGVGAGLGACDGGHTAYRTSPPAGEERTPRRVHNVHMGEPTTRAEWRALGTEARRRVPPSTFASWSPARDRPDPLALLEEQATSRIPDLVPIRYGRMAAGPFPFLRGAALPMAADLASLPNTGLTVQLCGDAHLCNFGLYASPERDLVFDINDFDETHPGPFEWDLLRLSASLVVAARSRGFSAHDGRHAVHAAIRSYRAHIADYAALRAIEVYYAKVDAAAVLEYVHQRSRPYLEATIKAASHHDALHELPKITTGTGRDRRIIDRPPVITHPEAATLPMAGATFDAYRQTIQEDRRVLLGRYALVDFALKVVGVGSVGLGAWALLLLGVDDDDPLFLQVKEAQQSVIERFNPGNPADHHGMRVVQGQRRLQAASDVLLGWATGPRGRHLYVRQLQDQKGSPVVEAMSASDLAEWGALCGWALARGHARSGHPASIAGYLGADDAVDQAMAAFGAAYADQSEKDHAALEAAIGSGRISATMGV
jgi:uncharacterized protein (DUF2252 family)